MTLIKLYNKIFLVIILLMVFSLTSMLTFAQSKENISQISLKISSLANLSSEDKSDLQENILKMIYFFGLDA